MARTVAKFFPKFKGVLRTKYLKENYKTENYNNDRVYYKESADLHKQEGDIGTGDRLSRVADGTAHKTTQLWGTTFRFYNVLKYIKRSNMTILDIGCADAFVRKMVHSGTYHSGTNYIGVDLKLKSVKTASDKMPKCNTPAAFICQDLYEGLPFLRSKSVDLIICMEIIEHLEEHAGMNLLKEMKRVLKDDGVIFLTQPNHDPSYWYVWRKNRATGYPWHLREYTVEEFKKIIDKKGFDLIDIYGNLAQRKRLLKALDGKTKDIYNRLCDIMGPEVPTQVFGQLELDACGGAVYVMKKKPQGE